MESLLRKIFFIIKIVISILTTVGNTTVLISLRGMRCTSEKYSLASLAVADLLLGTIVQPLMILSDYNEWNLERFTSILDVFCCVASVHSIYLLCWERWVGITTPFSCREKPSYMFLIFLWLIAIAMATMRAFIPFNKRFWEIGFVGVYSLLAFYLPACIVLIRYHSIKQTLKKPKEVPVQTHRGRAPGAVENQCKDGQNEQANSIKSPKDRAIHSITMIMSVFLITCLPFFIVLPINVVCQCMYTWLPELTTWLRFLNSALNPLVYSAGWPCVMKALQDFFNRGRRTTMACADGCN